MTRLLLCVGLVSAGLIAAGCFTFVSFDEGGGGPGGRGGANATSTGGGSVCDPTHWNSDHCGACGHACGGDAACSEQNGLFVCEVDSSTSVATSRGAQIVVAHDGPAPAPATFTWNGTNIVNYTFYDETLQTPRKGNFESSKEGPAVAFGALTAYGSGTLQPATLPLQLVSTSDPAVVVQGGVDDATMSRVKGIAVTDVDVYLTHAGGGLLRANRSCALVAGGCSNAESETYVASLLHDPVLGLGLARGNDELFWFSTGPTGCAYKLHLPPPLPPILTLDCAISAATLGAEPVAVAANEAGGFVAVAGGGIFWLPTGSDMATNVLPDQHAPIATSPHHLFASSASIPSGTADTLTMFSIPGTVPMPLASVKFPGALLAIDASDAEWVYAISDDVESSGTTPRIHRWRKPSL